MPRTLADASDAACTACQDSKLALVAFLAHWFKRRAFSSPQHCWNWELSPGGACRSGPDVGLPPTLGRVELELRGLVTTPPEDGVANKIKRGLSEHLFRQRAVCRCEAVSIASACDAKQCAAMRPHIIPAFTVARALGL